MSQDSSGGIHHNDDGTSHDADRKGNTGNQNNSNLLSINNSYNKPGHKDDYKVGPSTNVEIDYSMNNNNNNSDIYMKKISQSIVIHKNHDNNYDDDDDDDDGNIDANSSLLVGGIENIHSDHNSINNDDNDNNNDNAPTKFLYLLIGCLAIGGFLFGYDTGVIAGALLPIKEEFGLSSQEQEFVVGGTTLGAILGGLLAGALSDLIGRKPVTLLSSVIFIVGAALMT
ncbi:hypothetical protein BX616_007190, partial [Lobosporangium transversale]